MINHTRIFLLTYFIIQSSACSNAPDPLGENIAIRIYTEFADGTHRGMYDPETGINGFQDENYDATSAMVINWHRLPEDDPALNSRLNYRRVHPSTSEWNSIEGESFEYWYRDELINRAILRELQPGSVYEFIVSEGGESYHFKTMPESLDQRPLRIVMTSDHQSPSWSQTAHDNAKMAAILRPDMFIAAGDFVNDEGIISQQNADRWAMYLDNLYGCNDGYFIYDEEIDGYLFNNIIIPHLSILGNHETGQRNHIRWPSCVVALRPDYPMFVAANWMELLFHWPYSSQGFYSEFRPDHPNMDPDQVQEGFGRGGFGKLSFSDYLLLIGLDNSQNWEGPPDRGLRDWEGNLITEKWPWFETHHSDVRQDFWLKNLLEPDGEISAGKRYTHIIPMWHRGLFGTVRLNMSLKNREILNYWLSVLYRNNIRLIYEGHDHSYTRTIPMEIDTVQPENTTIKRIYYEPNRWSLTGNLNQEYIDDYYAVNSLIDNSSGKITGWEYKGRFISHDSKGFIVIGHGGWAAGRREPGSWGGGNAGYWFVDNEKGGEYFGGDESFHINLVTLEKDIIQVETYNTGQLINFENGHEILPVIKFKWDANMEKWCSFDFDLNNWVDY